MSAKLAIRRHQLWVDLDPVSIEPSALSLVLYNRESRLALEQQVDLYCLRCMVPAIDLFVGSTAEVS